MDDGFHEEPVIFLSHTAMLPKKNVSETGNRIAAQQETLPPGAQQHAMGRTATRQRGEKAPIGRRKSKAAVASTNAMKAKRLKTAATSQLELV